MSRDEYYMKRCLELAQKGGGAVYPNPKVGAILVYKDRIIGEGWHQEYGSAHAEVNCIANVSEQDRPLIRNSTMYVSLEPCSHYGKTPPCANRLVDEQVKKVVICNVDPFPKVQGEGIKIMQAANIGIVKGILEEDGLWLNRRFFCFHQQKRPYVILKWAQSKDGYFAPIDRSRLQMTNKSSKQLVCKWRAEEAAILVGYQTALSDDPELTVREWKGDSPLRVVFDRDLLLPEKLKLFDGKVDTWVINSKRNEKKGRVSYVKLDFEKDIQVQLLQKLYSAQKVSLIVEGGAKLLQSFIDVGIWDEARVFTAEKKLSGGITTPVLSNAKLQYSTDIISDKLDVYTNNSIVFKYREDIGL